MQEKIKSEFETENELVNKLEDGNVGETETSDDAVEPISNMDCGITYKVRHFKKTPLDNWIYLLLFLTTALMILSFVLASMPILETLLRGSLCALLCVNGYRCYAYEKRYVWAAIMFLFAGIEIFNLATILM